MTAIRSDKEMAKLFAGFGTFVGDKIVKVTDTIKYTEKDKKQKVAEATE